MLDAQEVLFILSLAVSLVAFLVWLNMASREAAAKRVVAQQYAVAPQELVDVFSILHAKKERKKPFCASYVQLGPLTVMLGLNLGI